MATGTVIRRPASKTSAMHDQPAVDAESLTSHVIRARRYEKPDHIGDVLRLLHTPQGDPLCLPTGELFGRQIEQGRLLTSYGGPHIRLDKTGAHAIHPNPVARVGHGEALGHIDDCR